MKKKFKFKSIQYIIIWFSRFLSIFYANEIWFSFSSQVISASVYVDGIIFFHCIRLPFVLTVHLLNVILIFFFHRCFLCTFFYVNNESFIILVKAHSSIQFFRQLFIITVDHEKSNLLFSVNETSSFVHTILFVCFFALECK